jgi:hypothetical protein
MNDRPTRDETASDDIAARHWTGGPLDCTTCPCVALRERPGAEGCAPGHACMQDAYALRINRFFHWHRDLADAHLGHPYFEVRAIAARYASVFHLSALVYDPDETVRLQIALRLPLAQLSQLAHDPHREVRIRVAQRLPAAELAALRNDPDYGVRELVARRIVPALLPGMRHDTDRVVRMRVAERLDMPALLPMASDAEPEVRQIVAQRLPTALLHRLVADPDWRVRWEVARRADPSTLPALRHDLDPEVQAVLREREQELAAAPPTSAVQANGSDPIHHPDIVRLHLVSHGVPPTTGAAHG